MVWFMNEVRLKPRSTRGELFIFVCEGSRLWSAEIVAKEICRAEKRRRGCTTVFLSLTLSSKVVGDHKLVVFSFASLLGSLSKLIVKTEANFLGNFGLSNRVTKNLHQKYRKIQKKRAKESICSYYMISGIISYIKSMFSYSIYSKKLTWTSKKRDT